MLKQKIKQHIDTDLGKKPDLDFWESDCEDVCVNIPEKLLIIAKKENVLLPFLKEFERSAANKEKINRLAEVISLEVKKLKEVNSLYANFSDDDFVLELKVFLDNKSYKKNVFRALLDIRLMIEDLFDDYSIEFDCIPLLENCKDEVLTTNFSPVYIRDGKKETTFTAGIKE